MKAHEKQRTRLSVADILLLVLAAAAILAVVLYANRQRIHTDREQAFLCLVRVSGVEKSLLDAHGGELIPSGSILRSENGTAELGRVERVAVREHFRSVLRDGEVLWEADEGLVDLELTVRMRGIDKGYDGVRVKDLRIAAGGVGTFRIGNYYAAGAELLSVLPLGAA